MTTQRIPVARLTRGEDTTDAVIPMSQMIPPWAAGDWAPGDMSSHGGNFYVCEVLRTSAHTQTPAADTAGWSQFDGVGQALTDAQIGDKAFSNPPSDLSNAEKQAVRTAIDAGSSTGGLTAVAVTAPVAGDGTSGSPITVPVVTATTDGLMDNVDKAKLDRFGEASQYIKEGDYDLHANTGYYGFQGLANFLTSGRDRRGEISFASNTSGAPSSGNAIPFPTSSGSGTVLLGDIARSSPTEGGFNAALSATDFPNGLTLTYREHDHDPATNYLTVTLSAAGTDVASGNQGYVYAAAAWVVSGTIDPSAVTWWRVSEYLNKTIPASAVAGLVDQAETASATNIAGKGGTAGQVWTRGSSDENAAWAAAAGGGLTIADYANNTAYAVNDILRTGTLGAYDYWICIAPVTTANTTSPAAGNTSFEPLSADVTVTGNNITLTRTGAKVDLTTDTLSQARTAGNPDHIGGKGGTSGQVWTRGSSDTDAGWANATGGGSGNAVANPTHSDADPLLKDLTVGTQDYQVLSALEGHTAELRYVKYSSSFNFVNPGITTNRGGFQIFNQTTGVPTDANQLRTVAELATIPTAEPAAVNLTLGFAKTQYNAQGGFAGGVTQSQIEALVSSTLEDNTAIRLHVADMGSVSDSGTGNDAYWYFAAKVWRTGVLPTDGEYIWLDQLATDLLVRLNISNVIGLNGALDALAAAITNVPRARFDPPGAANATPTKLGIRAGAAAEQIASIITETALNMALGVGGVNFYSEFSDAALNDNLWAIDNDSQGYFTLFDSTTTLDDSTLFTVAAGSRPFRDRPACTLQMNVVQRSSDPDRPGGGFTAAFTAPDLPVGTIFVMTNNRDGDKIGRVVLTTTAAPAFLMTGNRRYFNVQCSMDLQGNVEAFNRGVGGFVVARFADIHPSTLDAHLPAAWVSGVLSAFNLPIGSRTRIGAWQRADETSIASRLGATAGTPRVITTGDLPLDPAGRAAFGIEDTLFPAEDLGHFYSHNRTLVSLWGKGSGTSAASGRLIWTQAGLLINETDQAGTSRETALDAAATKRFRLSDTGDADREIAIIDVHTVTQDSDSAVPTDNVRWQYTVVQGRLSSQDDLPGGTSSIRIDELVTLTGNLPAGGVRVDSAGTGLIIDGLDQSNRNISAAFTRNRSLQIFNADNPQDPPYIYAYTNVTAPTGGTNDYGFATVTRTDSPPKTDVVLYDRMVIKVFNTVTTGELAERSVSGRQISSDPTVSAILGQQFASRQQVANLQPVQLAIDARVDQSMSTGLGAPKLVKGVSWILEDDATPLHHKVISGDIPDGYYPMANYGGPSNAVRRATISAQVSGLSPDETTVSVTLRANANGGAGSNPRNGNGFFFMGSNLPTSIGSGYGEHSYNRGFVLFWEGFREAAYGSVNGTSGYTGSFQLAPKVAGTDRTNILCRWDARYAWASGFAANGGAVAPTSGSDQGKLVVRAGSNTYASGDYARVTAILTQAGRLNLYVGGILVGVCTWPVSVYGTGTGENPYGLPYRTDWPLSRVGVIPATLPDWEVRASTNPYYINSLVKHTSGGTTTEYIMTGRLFGSGRTVTPRFGTDPPNVDTNNYRPLLYNPTTDYRINDICKHGGKYWIADSDPTAGQTPGVVSPAIWREIRTGEVLYAPGINNGFAGHTWRDNPVILSKNPDVRLQRVAVARNLATAVDALYGL